MTRASVAAAIIAGGAGRRQGGRDKTTLVIDGQTILQRQLAVLQPRFSRVLLVRGTAGAGEDAAPGVTVVHDRAPGSGPLAGLDAALAALVPGETAVVCVAGDMPLLQPGLLDLLRDAYPAAAAVVPRIGGRADPLLARYAPACAPVIANALASHALRTTAVLGALDVAWLDEPVLRAVDPALFSFENANTPEDVARIEALARLGPAALS